MYNLLKNIHNKRPLIYNVTNTETINDCANVQVSLGARPIMSFESLEAENLIKASKAVNLNIGTINKKIFKLIKNTIFYVFAECFIWIVCILGTLRHCY